MPMVSQELIDRYWAKGWVVIEDVYKSAEVERIAQIALAISQEELKDSSSSYKVDRSEAGEVAPRKIDRPFEKSEDFRRFVLDERLATIIGKLLGDRPLPVTDQIFMKPPRFGSAKPYHQDNAYFKCSPADGVITAWIALDDVDEENGCLRYIDGSHKGPILPHEPIPDEPHNKAPAPHLIDLNKESLAIVCKGGVVFHHSQTLHTSHRNESDRWRRAYATHWATAEVTSENDTLDKAYYKTALYKEQLARV